MSRRSNAKNKAGSEAAAAAHRVDPPTPAAPPPAPAAAQPPDAPAVADEAAPNPDLDGAAALDGGAPEDPAPQGAAVAEPDAIVPGTAPEEAAEDLSDLPRIVQEALPALNLKRRQILNHRMEPDHVVIITRGGRKFRYPGFPEDQARALALTEDEKDGVVKHVPFFPPGHLDSGRPRR